MKLAPRDIDGFIRFPQKFAGALIYGLDEGQVRARVRELTASWMGKDADAINRVEFNADQLTSDTARLSDEMAAFNLLGGKRVVMVREATDALCAQIGEALEVRAPDNFLILYTHDSLSGSSKLRSFCERHELIASVPCYKDEGAGLAQIIRTTLRGYGLKASNEVIEYLAARLQGDRQVVLSELEKLSLYLGDDAEEVSMENALFLTADSREMSLDELCFAVAGGNIETVCRMVDTLTNEGVQPVVIVRSLMRYLQRLELAAQARYAGASLDVAIDQMRPPIFFKHKPLFRQHASRWSLGKIHDALHCLHRLEFTTKCESKMARVLLSQGLMDIAHMVTPQQRAA